MRKNFGAKPFSYPQPVLIIGSYDEEGTPDAMNAAWGGVSDYEEFVLCLSSGHKTVKNILAKKALTISMGVESRAAACDYVGLVSANDDKDKFAKAGFHALKSEYVDAPLIAELPLALECTLKSYDPETGLLFARLVNVSADESVLDGEGALDLQRLRPLSFDPFGNAYLSVGTKICDAFKEGKKLMQ